MGVHSAVFVADTILVTSQLFSTYSTLSVAYTVPLIANKSPAASTNASTKPQLEVAEGLRAGYYTQGGARKLCLRIAGSNVRYTPQPDERIIYAEQPARDMETRWRVWRFVDAYGDGENHYLIACSSKGVATRKAKQIITKRLMRYRGLARRAISLLMGKTYTGAKTPADNVGVEVTAKAQAVTGKIESIKQTETGGLYTLVLDDRLRYAIPALKQGKASVDLALKKSANKIISAINHKLKDGAAFFSDKLETPFPEIRQRARK